MRSYETQLSVLVAERLTDSARPLRVRSLYRAFINPTKLVDEFASARDSRRAARLTSCLEFLRRHNVLLHGLLFYQPSTRNWNVLPEFSRLALVGEALLQREVSARLLKVFPSISPDLFTSVLNSVMGEESLAEMFDKLNLCSIVGNRPDRPDAVPSAVEKAHMMCAIIGEMHWFTVRTRATDRTHNNALFPPSDALILHVLAAHTVESLPAELIHALLRPIVTRVLSAWTNFPMSVPEQLTLKPATFGSMTLSQVQRGQTPEEEQRARKAATSAVHRNLTLSPDPVYNSVESRMAVPLQMKRFELPWYAIRLGDHHTPPARLAQVRQAPQDPLSSPKITPERRAELLRAAPIYR